MVTKRNLFLGVHPPCLFPVFFLGTRFIKKWIYKVMIQHTVMFGFKLRLTFGRNTLNSREKDDSSHAPHGRDSTCWEED